MLAKAVASLVRTAVMSDWSDLFPTRTITVLVGSVSLVKLLPGHVQPMGGALEAFATRDIENDEHHIGSLVAALEHTLESLVAGDIPLLISRCSA